MISLDTPLSSVTFVSVDVETTGLDPARDAIVEIGAVKLRGRQIVGEWDTLVYCERTIPLAARRIHGISNEMLVGQPRISEAMRLLMGFADGGVLVEHSHRAFDVLFLEAAHGRVLDVPYVNTCMLSRKLFPHIPRHSLDECCKRFGIVNDERLGSGRHRALADARATTMLLTKLLELSGPRYPRLSDLVQVCSVERSVSSAPRRHRSRA
jgi:DNA polymerase-3 subunit epsilon